MNKTHLIKECRRILYSDSINYKDTLFLNEILSMHPDYETKKGGGVKYYFVKQNRYGKCGFNIMRIDGTTTDFSFMKCISPPTKEKIIKAACRSAIRPTIKAFKRNDLNEVHHSGTTFNQIFEYWIKENKGIDLRTNKSKDNSQETYFINRETTNSFVCFHNKAAMLVEVTLEEHKKLHQSH